MYFLLPASVAILLGAQEAAAPPPRVAHLLVALADNKYQGIVPVPAGIGNGDLAEQNLYWGAGYGVKTHFRRSPEWKLLGCEPVDRIVLERCIFRRAAASVFIVADAYRGREIKRAITDFLKYLSGQAAFTVRDGIAAGGGADLIGYIGHNGLMDFGLDRFEYGKDQRKRQAIVVACASKGYFGDAIRWSGGTPLLWTTHLLAPEAYVTEAALAGWVARESGEQIRRRAALAYHRIQKTGEKAAMSLFATGW